MKIIEIKKEYTHFCRCFKSIEETMGIVITGRLYVRRGNLIVLMLARNFIGGFRE